MTHDEFIAEYHKVSERAIQLSKTVRRGGLLALEDSIDFEKADKRDIFEYGLRFVVDGTDAGIIKNILSRIIEQEEDKHTRRLMDIKAEAVLSIQAGDNPRILVSKLNAFMDFTLKNDPFIQKMDEEMDDKGTPSTNGALSNDEINELLKGTVDLATPEGKKVFNDWLEKNGI
jgi:flagellar motor component MotA